MNELSTSTSGLLQEGRQGPSYLNKPRQRENKIFNLWYRLASPVEPGALASFDEQERFRRGRTGSQIILALYLFIAAIAASILSGSAGTNAQNLSALLVYVFLALVIATVLNRLGKVTIAGVIIVIAFIAEPTLNILTTPGGLNMMVLPVYGLLVLPLVCAVTFLPAWWVFVIAIGNCIFTYWSLNYMPATAELSAILFGDGTVSGAIYAIVIPILISQAIVSIVAYIWVQGASKALIRADNAEELVKLEHDLAVQARVATQEKQQLESSIQKIIDTHMRVANGDFDARVPLTEDNTLWQISGSLNNLLSRTQRLRQESARLQQVEASLRQAREENRRLLQRIDGR
jgi:hypothetical protein